MEFSELVDIVELQNLCDAYCANTSAVIAILDLKGKVLISTGWQDLCTKFHRTHAVTARRCCESDTVLAGRLGAGESYNVYKCKNGLIDVAVPILIDGEHVANFFTGQFFFERPDQEFFIRQAEEFGFDQNAYLDALARVPIVTEDHVKRVMSFFLYCLVCLAKWGLLVKDLRKKMMNWKAKWKFGRKNYLVLIKN